MHFSQNNLQQKLSSIYNLHNEDIKARTTVFQIESDQFRPEMDRSNSHYNMSVNVNETDFLLGEAAKAFLEKGDITPILKEELKCKIQSRRVAEGKDEMKADFTPKQDFKLSPEEEIRVQKRKEQNRLAAQKFRQKQKNVALNLRKKIQSLESHNTFLRTELKRLQSEKKQLHLRLQEHVAVCPRLGTIT